MRRTIPAATLMLVAAVLFAQNPSYAQDKAGEESSVEGIWKVAMTAPATAGGREIEDVLLIAGGELRSKIFLALGYEAGKVMIEKNNAGDFRISASLDDRRGGFVRYSGSLDPEGRGRLTINRHVPGRPAAMYSARVTSFDARDVSATSITKQAVDWVAANNIWHAKHAVVVDTEKKVAPEVKAGKGFQWRLGAKLVKSGKATILASFGGELFVVELTPDQATALGLDGANAVFVPESKTGSVRGPSSGVSDFKLTGDRPGADGKLQGTVALERPDRGVRARYALRLTVTNDNSTTQSYAHLGSWLTKDSVAFSFSNPISGDKPKTILGYVDIGAFVGSNDYLPISKPIPVVMKIHPKPK